VLADSEAGPRPYDVWETVYEQIHDRLWPIETSLPGFARAWFDGQPRTVVLDLGCGDGKNLRWLVDRGYTVIGVDGSASALRKCARFMQQVVHDADAPRRYALLPPMDVRTLAPRAELTDIPAAICVDVLGHQPDPERTLGELHRVLRPGGFAVISVFHADDEVRHVAAPVMERLNARDYHYRPDPDRRFFFRFYEAGEPEALVARAGFVVRRCEAHRWREPPHPGYREVEHTHTSWFLLVEKT